MKRKRKKYATLSIAIDPEMKKVIKALAKKEKKTVSTFARLLIERTITT